MVVCDCCGQFHLSQTFILQICYVNGESEGPALCLNGGGEESARRLRAKSDSTIQ